MNNLYLDISVIQTLGANCVNRDDTGSPKTVEYGGVTRARVSSQAWKRAMREQFKKNFFEEDIGKRTKYVVKLISDKILAIQPTEEYIAREKAITVLLSVGLVKKDETAEKFYKKFESKFSKKGDDENFKNRLLEYKDQLNDIVVYAKMNSTSTLLEEEVEEKLKAIEVDGKLMPEKTAKSLVGELCKLMGKNTGNDNSDAIEDDKTSVLYFIGNKQAEELAKIAIDKNKYNEAEFKNKAYYAIKNNPSYDMTLFGRMVAADAGLNIDAASQVAHAISTHAVHNEYDYFTAVDDLSEELDETGAGHIGVSEFNSSTLYRYASVNINELKKDHPGHEAEIVAGFIEAFISSMPSGKGNSFANNTLPELVYVTIRKDQPISFVGAFEKPVKSEGEGFVKPSIERLEKYAGKVYNDYCGEPYKAYVIGSEFGGAEKVNKIQLLDKVREAISDEVK